MEDPKLINIGTPENPRMVREDLVWGNTLQSPEDHRAEGIASGSVLPNEHELEIQPNAPHEPKA